MILTPREAAALSEILALAARIEARTGKRLTTEQPGRGCFLALLDGLKAGEGRIPLADAEQKLR